MNNTYSITNSPKEYIKEFGIKPFVISGATRILKNFFSADMFEKYYNFKHRYLIKYLDKKYGKEVEKCLNNYSNNEKIKRDDPIWVFWLQGEKNMPPIVKACYNSILQNAQQHSVILLDQNNIGNYVKLSKYIYEKVDSDKMLPAHFSDIVRENLLYKYGGIWLDATIYMTSPFPDTIYNYDYYTIKGASSLWDWTTFFQASGKGNIFPKAASHLFNCYWKEHNYAITYLLFDCLLAVARKRNNIIDKQITDLPNSGDGIFSMLKKVEEPYDEKTLKLIDKESNIHKLTYKNLYNKTIDDKLTIWGYLTQEKE